jgi:hypothetical protein
MAATLATASWGISGSVPKRGGEDVTEGDRFADGKASRSVTTLFSTLYYPKTDE